MPIGSIFFLPFTSFMSYSADFKLSPFDGNGNEQENEVFSIPLASINIFSLSNASLNNAL